MVIGNIISVAQAVGISILVLSTMILLFSVGDEILFGREWRVMFAALPQQPTFLATTDYGDKFENGILNEERGKGTVFIFRFMGLSVISVFRTGRATFIWIPHWVFVGIGIGGCYLAKILIGKKKPLPGFLVA